MKESLFGNQFRTLRLALDSYLPVAHIKYSFNSPYHFSFYKRFLCTKIKFSKTTNSDNFIKPSEIRKPTYCLFEIMQSNLISYRSSSRIESERFTDFTITSRIFYNNRLRETFAMVVVGKRSILKWHSRRIIQEIILWDVFLERLCVTVILHFQYGIGSMP